MKARMKQRLENTRWRNLLKKDEKREKKERKGKESNNKRIYITLAGKEKKKLIKWSSREE